MCKIPTPPPPPKKNSIHGKHMLTHFKAALVYERARCSKNHKTTPNVLISHSILAKMNMHTHFKIGHKCANLQRISRKQRHNDFQHNHLVR